MISAPDCSLASPDVSSLRKHCTLSLCPTEKLLCSFEEAILVARHTALLCLEMTSPEEVAPVRKAASSFHPQQAVLSTFRAALRLANCWASKYWSLF